MNVVTHAHADHYPEGEATAVCSELTAALATACRGYAATALRRNQTALDDF